ncbi:MAG TPA: aromatic ring-hydroxylating dioxygenase subunit alpha [Allosphingosinicella sp.]|jgi:phenylpropionate dioxygenase-like ring-hydroxylating dioxygenase large terminal subunit
MVAGWPAAIASGWHPVAFSSAVDERPVAATLMGRRLVVARDEKGPFVLDDRCPHRGAPLSRGRIQAGAVVCPYHGWRFGRGGECLEVPGSPLPGSPARALPCVDKAGLVWASLADAPSPFPTLPGAVEDQSLDRFWWPLAATPAGLLDSIENHLDPAHPHHVHPWMVRSPNHRRPVEVSVRSGPWGAEAVYLEGRAAAGLMPRLLEGKRVRSVGRYYPPSIAEVAFEGKRGLKLSVVVIFGPEDDGLTRPWAHFATPRGLAPAWLKRAALKTFHLPVLTQDRRMLQLQLEWRQSQPPLYAIGPLDVVGPTIWRLANGLDEPERERSLLLEL